MLLEDVIPEKHVTTDNPAEAHELLEEFTATYHQTTLDSIVMRADGTVEFDKLSMPYTQSFLEGLAHAIQMPLQYAYRLDLELFQHNFHQRKRQSVKAITVCVVRGAAVSVAPSEYRPARNKDIFPEAWEATGIWTFKSTRISDFGVEVDLVGPELTASPRRGDVIELGVRISNSETGHRGLKASLFSYRLVCSNGAVMADSLGAIRWNYDRRVTYASSIEKFLGDLSSLKDQHVRQRQLYDGIGDAILDDASFVNLFRRLQLNLNATSEEIDGVLGIELKERQEIAALVRSRQKGVASEPTPWLIYDIHNRITAAAQHMDFRRRSRLEELGGRLLYEATPNNRGVRPNGLSSET